MSRVKRSSGKEYRRLTQATDSDDEVVLFPLSPVTPRPPSSSSTTTTEFGNGLYDKSCDLELPSPPQHPRRGRQRQRGVKPAVRLKKGFGWRASREARACLCFLALLGVALLVVALAWLQLKEYPTANPSTAPLHSSVSLSTSVTASPSPLSNPTTEPQANTEESQTTTTEPQATTEEPQTTTNESHDTTEEPQTTTNEPHDTTEEPQTSTNESHDTTEEPQTTTNEPHDTTEEPQTTTNESHDTTEEPQTTINEPHDTTEEPQTTATEPQATTQEPQTTTNEPQATTQEPQTTTNEPQATTEEPQTTTTEPQATTQEPPTSEETPSAAEGENTTTVTQSVSNSTTEETAASSSVNSSPVPPLTSSPAESLIPSPYSPTSPLTVTTGGEEAKRTISWHRDFFPGLTETSLQLRDLNGDGTSDVVMVEGKGQCEMVVRVLNGLTGASVWEANVTYDAFAVRCEVDLDKDGLVDCIAAGRQGGFRALHGSNGSILWDRDPQIAFLKYNFYFPLFVPDLDGDGVQDIIITHGGDSTYRDKDTNRSPGLLAAVSGATGRQLMDRVVLPDGQETYNSPVYLSRGGEGDMILVGTGGETLPGSLWAFGYDSLKERISRYLAKTGGSDYTLFTGYVNHMCERDMTEEEMESERPTFDAGSFNADKETKSDQVFSHCRSWGLHKPVWNKFGLCVYQIVSGEEKGVILPPVVVEMTGDQQYDLLVSLFEGKSLVINGDTGQVVWEVSIPGTESYSIPAPLFFNSDSTPDLLVRVNYGEWDTYNHSTIAVLDGETGHKLWSFGSIKTGMMSGLSLASTSLGADAAVFITMGTIEDNNSTAQATDWRRAVLEKEEERGRRHEGPHDTAEVKGKAAEEEGGVDEEPQGGLWDGAGTEFPDPVLDLQTFLDYCGWTEEELTASLYILSPQQALSDPTPPPLFSSGPFVYFPGYQDEETSGASSNHTPNSDNSSRDNWRELRCSHVMIPEMIVSTPAIGDLDEDGQLEIAYLVSWRSNSRGEAVQDLPPRFTVFVQSVEERVREVMGEEGVKWLQDFLPGQQQPWTHYMGARGDNIYLQHTS